MDLIPDDESKAKVVYIYEDNIFLFIYDMKNITLSKFPNLGLCDVSKCRPKTKFAVEL